MVSPQEFPEDSNRSDRNSSHKQSPTSEDAVDNATIPKYLREEALPIFAAEYSQRLLHVLHQATQAPGPVLKSQQLLDLQHEVKGLLARPTGVEALRILEDVAKRHATCESTVVAVAAMLRRLFNSGVHEAHRDQLNRLVATNYSDRGDRDAALQGLCRLVSLSLKGWGGGLSGDKLLDTLARGHLIVQGSSLTPERREGFLEVVGNLASYQGHFRGVQAIRRCFEDTRITLDTPLLVTVLNGGVSVGDAPKFIIKALTGLIPVLERSEHARDVLRGAVVDQVKQEASVEALMQSLAGLLAEYSEANHPALLTSYATLTERLRPYATPLHLLRREHVEQFDQSNPTTYSKRLAQHMAGVAEVLEIARDARRYSNDSLKSLQAVLSVNQRPEMVTFFQMFFTTVASHCRAPNASLAPLTKMAVILANEPKAWPLMVSLLDAQIKNNRSCDGLIDVMSDVADHSFNALGSRELWHRWSVLASSLSEQIPDMSFLNREVMDWFFREPTEGRFKYLTSLLECADRLLPHLPRDTDLASVTKGLLRQGGPGATLMQALSHHEKNGYSSDALLTLYILLEPKLSSAGVAVLQQVARYQVKHKLSLEEVFRNFAEMAEYTNAHFVGERQDEAWQSMSSLVGELIPRNVPLDYLGISCFEEYVTGADGDKVLRRIEQYLHTFHRIATDPNIGVDGPLERKFLAAVADLGPYSRAGQIVEMLTTSDSEEDEVLELSDIAALCEENLELISPEAWIAIGRSIEAYRAEQYPLQRLVRDIVAVDREIADTVEDVKEVWRSAMELLVDLREAKLPFDLISGEFVKRFHDAGEEPQALLLHFVRGMSRFSEQLLRHGQPDSREALRKTLSSITSNNFGLTDNPAMVHKLNLILANGGITTVADFFAKLRDLKMHALTDIMRNATDEARKTWARELMSREFNMGGPPYEEGSREARRHFNQTMEVVDRALRDSKGFGGLALDSRGVPRSAELESVPPMLLRFGIDSARQTFILNSSDNQSFPGKGCVIQGIRADKVFSADPEWQEQKKSSPYWRWTEGNGLFNNQYFLKFNMDFFEQSTFLFMRGLKIVVPPESIEFILDREHYSYLVYNRHFYPGPEVALLVPTVVLRDFLGNSLVRAEDYRGFNHRLRDVSKVDFSFDGLLAQCKARKLNLLDLTYGSVIGGGLCNAYQPRSSPHYEWERAANASYGWTDSWGHVHKSFRLGGYSQMGRSLDESLRDARKLHSAVYGVVRPLQDYLSAAGFALSFYKMGSTLISDTDLRQTTQERQQEQQDADRGEELSFEDALAFQQRPVHEYRYRMLEETYRWYRGAKEQGWQREQFPILHFAWVLDPNSLPPASQRKFEIDLATMVLKTPEGSFQLPKDGNGMGEEERELWRQYVVPFLGSESEGWEPRFLLRDGAFQIHE